MNKGKFIKIFMIFTLNVALLASFSCLATAAYKQGSKGENVKTIQTKLKNWGYYKGSVDGVFGSETKKAVISFQKKNGLTADGVVGKKTLEALGISDKSSSSGSSSSGSSPSTNNDHYLLSRMISAEARGEPYEGQVAVGAVIMNRVNHPSFPNSISGVLFQPGAFSALLDEIGRAHV